MNQIIYIVLLACFAFITKAEALKCFNCSSQLQGDACIDTGKNTPLVDVSFTKHGDAKHFDCGTAHMRSRETKMDFIIRGYSAGESFCESIERVAVESKFIVNLCYQCNDTDGCNKSFIIKV